MKAAAAIKVLEANGWTKVRQSGSHVTFKKAGVAGIVTVPVHGSKDLTPGVLASIKRISGLTF